MIGIERKTEVLGAGAFTTVSAEWDPLLGRVVAVKELNSPFAQNTPFARAFLERAQRLFDLDHEHVLAVYRIDTSRQAPAVVRELAPETLESSAVAGPLPPARVEKILGQALRGLKAMHDRDLVHGAMKPQNLFLCGDLLDEVKIGDFGLAGVAGTPGLPPVAVSGYTPPELLRGEAAVPGSDLYSLGMVVYELVLGRARFERLPRINLPPLQELLPDVSPTLALAVEQMTRMSLGYRAGDAMQVLDLLDRSSGKATVPSLPPSTSTSTLDARLRPTATAFDVKKLKRALAITLGVVLAGLGASAALFLRNQRPAEGHATAPKTAQARLGTVTPTKGPISAAPQPPPGPPPQADASVLSSSGSPSVPPAPRLAPPKPVASAPLTASQASSAPNEAKPRQPLQPPAGNSGSQSVAEMPSLTPAHEEAISAKKIPSGREVIFEIQPSHYQLGTIHSGQRAYVDLDAVFADVPERHDRLPCIETAIADRGNKNGSLSFDLSRNARIYIGHDRSIKRKPAWLRDFHPTGEAWSLLVRDTGGSGSTVLYFDVYTRSFPAGVVSLGPNMDNGLFSTLRSLGGKYLGKGDPGMYLVCVDAR